MTNKKNILYNGIIGLAVGDALGVPAEFKTRKELKANPITDMTSGGYWGQPEGTWSDDTAMTLATIDALNKSNWKNGALLGDLVMVNFESWYTNSTFATNNNRFDVGNTCKEAIEHYRKFNNTENCGLREGRCGNGSLMRILPTMFLHNEVVLKVSRLTHNNETCDLAALAYTRYARELAKGTDKNEAISVVLDTLKNKEQYNKTVNKLSKETSEEEIFSTGYVIDTFEAAMWCFLTTDNYKDCVLKAVNLGEDTDTIAAVAGGLAGIYYGIASDENKAGIPLDWINKLQDIETINEILNAANLD